MNKFLQTSTKLPIILAHRGARLVAPENTLPAFQMALELGADGVECDVMLTKDKQIVVIHDQSLDRTTNSSGKVRNRSARSIKQLDAGSYFSEHFKTTPVPTLDEALDAFGHKMLFNIELKDWRITSPLPQLVIDCVEKHGVNNRVLISSFNPLLLRRTKEIAPEIPIGYLHGPRIPSVFLRRGANLIIGNHEARHPHSSMVNSEYMAWAQAHGYAINTWTVNQSSEVKRLSELGVTSIITDDPALAIASIDS